MGSEYMRVSSKAKYFGAIRVLGGQQFYREM